MNLKRRTRLQEGIDILDEVMCGDIFHCRYARVKMLANAHLDSHLEVRFPAIFYGLGTGHYGSRSTGVRTWGVASRRD
jgi:hypothetical protein